MTLTNTVTLANREILLDSIRDAFISQFQAICQTNFEFENLSSSEILDIARNTWDIKLAKIKDYPYSQLLDYYVKNFR